VARALIRNWSTTPLMMTGFPFTINVDVMFFGADLPDPRGWDVTPCSVEITEAMMEQDIKQAIRGIITAEAERLGYPFDGSILHIPALLIDL
jgi:hypothetical protein